MLNKKQSVQVSDTSKVDSSNSASHKIILALKNKFRLNNYDH
jgi:hypothetical protein